METPAPESIAHEVFIIYAGGTIGMKKTVEGFVPVANYLSEMIQCMPEFKDARMPRYTIKEYNPLLDSSNMGPDDWKQIALDIADNYDKYYGFVVLHGTDTMAHTASALSFMLQNLGKSVVITGAQIPLSEIRNDGRYNLISSVMIAGNFQIPEVCIFFDDCLLRGNRSKKVDIWGLRAFESYNYPILAKVGVDVNISASLLLPTPKGPFMVLPNMCQDIVCIRMFPGMSPQVFQQMVEGPSIKGIVLEVYGAGNFPEKKEYIEKLENVIKRGVVVVILSQVMKGGVNMDVYKAGNHLKKIGVISGYDMTLEAAVIKMQFLFGQGLTCDQVKTFMQRNLVGEFTPPAIRSEPGVVPDLENNETIQWPFQYHATLGYYSKPAHATSSTSLLRDSINVENNKLQTV